MSGSPILTDLKIHLYNSGLFDSYDAHSFFGINDDRKAFKEASNWTAFKRERGSVVDPAYGLPIVRLWIGGSRGLQASRDNTADQIVNYLTKNRQYGIIANIRVESDVNGPFSLSDDRSYHEIFLRLTQARC